MPSSSATVPAANRGRGSIMILAAVLALAVPLAGCVTDGDTTGAIALSTAPLPEGQAALRDYTATWGRKHDADPNDITAAINYGRGLRAMTQYAQAAAVLEATAAQHPNDKPLLAAYGKALADAGRPQDAMGVLERAHTPDKPDWSVLSAQGAVADQLGDHAGAIAYYDAALKIRPGDPTVLSNMGLSYALSKNLPRAEETMRLAAASPQADTRVRQNYALVLSLEGKFKQAEGVAATDLSPADAAASVDAIRQMIATDARWRGVGAGKLMSIKQAAN
jgi:Flp pilus assembly protein TadD